MTNPCFSRFTDLTLKYGILVRIKQRELAAFTCNQLEFVVVVRDRDLETLYLQNFTTPWKTR